MKQAVGRYVVSFQSAPFHKSKRYHWMICWTMKPNELVSWGHAPTQGLAEEAAEREVLDLCLELSNGGQINSKSRSVSH
jgi:hypothetical protein